MTQPSQQPTSRAAKGRPATIPPNGRDLNAEVIHLRQWMGERPAVKPATISKMAGLHREALGNILRDYRRPQAEALDRIYEVLKDYGYDSLVNTNKINPSV
jgi:hypothetical protein